MLPWLLVHVNWEPCKKGQTSDPVIYVYKNDFTPNCASDWLELVSFQLRRENQVWTNWWSARRQMNPLDWYFRCQPESKSALFVLKLFHFLLFLTAFDISQSNCSDHEGFPAEFSNFVHCGQVWCKYRLARLLWYGTTTRIRNCWYRSLNLRIMETLPYFPSPFSLCNVLVEKQICLNYFVIAIQTFWIDSNKYWPVHEDCDRKQELAMRLAAVHQLICGQLKFAIQNRSWDIYDDSVFKAANPSNI